MIENIELLAFIRENLALARTIVIKNEDLAILDNTNMLNYYGLDSGTDKSKWRYYLNLNGEYHITDEMMTVTSLDENEIINFTKETLENHPATKKAYRLGSYYFSRLVNRYPHQMELIQGIINPIPPEESLEANNYQILRYTKEYIEWNESQLIPKLQQFIDQTVYQSFNTEYKYTDNLVLPILIGHLSEGIFKFLLECRFEHRFTRHAHSFYIWSLLQSKGISPIYKDLLNAKQTMWLFRNIDWVLRNLGKEQTFRELIEILLSERNIPLSKYDLIQSTETMAKDLHSEPLFFTERLNLIEQKGLGQKVNTIARTMLREIPESIDNDIYYDKYLPITTEESTYPKETVYPIKILDSEMVDTSNRKPVTFYNVLNNELIYLAGKNLYNINLDIEEPSTGIHQRISVKDAIVLWHHLLNMYNGASCDKIPQFYYREALKIVPPTVNIMQSVGSKPFLSDTWCKDVIKTYIPQTRIVSPTIFYENALAIFNLKWDHEKMYSRYLSIGYYSQRKNAISTMYETGFIKLTDKETYSEFMEQFDYDFSHYRKEDYFSLMWEIWKKMTGWDQFSHITIAQIQNGMIGLMKFLSSYSVQYIFQTTIEEGWYEGGLDLMTENPSLMHGEGDGQLELESDVESNRIPVHHHGVLHTEESETYYIDSRLDVGTLESEMTDRGKVYETPMLYDVELSDNDKDDGYHSNKVMSVDYKLRLFTGKLPYELEDFIPKGGSRSNDHALREMIVDQFEGPVKVGPWVATGIRIVNNGLDNAAVATTVDGFDYVKIMDVVPVTTDSEENNRYYVGFVPSLLGTNVIKLDIIAKHEETEEYTTIRFDYDINTKTNTSAISYEIPTSVALENPFTITPTITGLSLGDETIVNESYIVYPEVSEYLTVNVEEGKLKGTFLKEGWPEELPLMYVIETTNGNSDSYLAKHYYYLRGLIPSDRYYNPLTDDALLPKPIYAQADINAITVERFTISAKSHGWEPINVSIKQNDDGSYPTDLIKTDYAGIKNYLTPRLSERGYFDKTTDNGVIRTFEFLYAVAKEDVTLPLIVTLQNEAGDVVYREFTYTPEVNDYNTVATYDIYPEENFKFGIGYSTGTDLTVTGLGDNITLESGITPTPIDGQANDVSISYRIDESAGVENNRVREYVVRPVRAITQDMTWAVQVEGHVITESGSKLTLRPYGTIQIQAKDVIDYDTLSAKDIVVKGWNQNTISAHAIIPTRYAIIDPDNGWEPVKFEVAKTNGNYPAFVGTYLPGVDSTNNLKGYEPTIVCGKDTDGKQTVPEGCYAWFTITMLAERNYLGDQEIVLSIPITATFKNKFSGKSVTISLSVSNNFSGKGFDAEWEPHQIYASTDNKVIPSWTGIPDSRFGTDVVLADSTGIFLGADKYKGGAGYTESTVCIWNNDDTADIILPKGPISDGNGIRIYNQRNYLLEDDTYANTSIEEHIYFPYVEYEKANVIRIPVPKLTDFDFTPLDNVDFYQGVYGSFITLYNADKITDIGWTVSDVQLAVKGTANQDDYIITTIDGKDLAENIYQSGIQEATYHDTPEGKEDYHSTYLSFVPAKTGKQTFIVNVTVSPKSSSVSGIAPRTYQYSFDIDVKDNEGVISYDDSYSDPWWLIGHKTYVLTQLTGLSYTAASNYLLLATVTDNNKAYLTADTEINYQLASRKSLVVNIPERFEDVSPTVIACHHTTIDGFNDGDPRAIKRYYGTLPVQPDRLYNESEINLDSLGFKPDVYFTTMNLNEVYTERYIHNANTRGWVVNTMKLREDETWMASYSEYEGVYIRNSDLFSGGTPNQTKDRMIDAPDGQCFFLPTYGSRKTGNFEYVIDIELSSQHHNDITKVTLEYVGDRKVIASDYTLNFTYEGMFIGKTNVLSGGLENVPGKDLNEAVSVNTDKLTVVGKNNSYIIPNKQPLSLTVSNDYPKGVNGGIKVVYAKLYNKEVSGSTVESATAFRAYRGEQVIPDNQIVKNIVFPTYEELDFTPMNTDHFFKEVGSTACILHNQYAGEGLTWSVSGVKLKVIGTSEQNNVIKTKVAGNDLTSTLYGAGHIERALPDAPEGKLDYFYTYVTFTPIKEGKQTFTVVITITVEQDGINYTKDYEVDLIVNVNTHEGNIVFDSSEPDPYWLVGEETYYLTDLTDVSSNLVSKEMIIATIGGENSTYASVRMGKNSNLANKNALAVTIPQKFSNVTPQAVVCYEAIFSNYGVSDVRAKRIYFGKLNIRPDRLYVIDEVNESFVNLEVDIEPDVRYRGVSQIERYVYDTIGRGWYVSKFAIVENEAWMNHIFTYDNNSRKSAQLFTSGKIDITYDMLTKAPDGKYFWLPKYGSRVVGDFNFEVKITLSCNHFNRVINRTVTYTKPITVVDSDIRMEFANEPILYIGQKTELGGDMVGFPEDGMNSGLRRLVSSGYPVGSNQGYFSAIMKPIAITTNAGYSGNGKGIMFGFTVSYSASQAGYDITSETTYRFYRADVIFPEEDIRQKS